METTPVTEPWEESPAPKKKNLAAPIVLGVIALACVALILVLVLGGGSPAKEFIGYHQSLLLAPFEGLSALEDGPEELSTDMTLTMSMNDPTMAELLDSTSLVMKIDVGEDRGTINYTLNMLDTDLLDVNMSYFDGILDLQIPQSGDTVYEFTVSQMMDMMEYLTGQSFDLEAMEKNQLTAKELSALAKTYFDLVSSAVTDKNVEKARKQEVAQSQLGGTALCTVYTYTPKAADIESMLLALADHLEQDEDLRSVILKVLAPAAVYSPDLGNAQSLNEELAQIVSDLRANAAQTGADVESSGFNWTLAVEGDEIRQICWNFPQEGGRMAFEHNGDEKNGTSVFYLSTYDELDGSISYDYAADGDQARGQLIFRDDDSDMDGMILSYDLNTGETSNLGLPYGEYSLELPMDEGSISLDVGADGEGWMHTLRAAEYGEEFFHLHMATTPESTAQPPLGPMDDMTDADVEQIEVFWMNIGNAIMENMMAALSEAMYG